MSFEHQLRPAFDGLTARLREDLERHLETAARELAEHAQHASADAAAERDAFVAQAVEQARIDARAEADRVANERHQSLLADAQARHGEEFEIARSQHRERVNQLEHDHRQAAEHAGRLEAQLQQQADDHRTRFDQQADEHKAQIDAQAREHEQRVQRTVADAEHRVLTSLQAADLAAGARLVDAFRAIDAAQTLSEILNALAVAVAAETPRGVIFLSGQAQARSWKAHGFAFQGTFDVAGEDAGIVHVALQSKAAASTAGDGGDDAGAKAPAFAQLPDERPAIAVPMIVNEEVVAIVYADQGPEGDLDRPSWAAVVEVLARHASRSLEAITAHRLAKTLGSGATRQRVVPKPADIMPAPVAMPAALSAALPTAQAAIVPTATPVVPQSLPVEDENTAAQRVARTLIAGIRAQHGDDVRAGLQQRDLMTRLGGPISRAWAEYEAQVPASIRSATNFFHAEMVRTLADGDASLLTPKP